jgi:DNA-binding transcriptional regulator YhcF (GntR family)
MINLININFTVAIPIYKQIVNSIYNGIQSGAIKYGDKLPSVNQVAAEFSLARGSVFTAYNALRAAGIIDSVPGKGYFVSGTQIQQKQNIFLLFSTFTPYKEVLYNSLIEHLQGKCSIDIYFHYHNLKVFENLIKEQAPYYNVFVVMPDDDEKVLDILQQLQEKMVFLLDVGLKKFGNFYSGVCQNFEKDIYNTLVDNSALLEKYERLYLIFPKNNRSTGILNGFKKFARLKKHQCSVVSSLQQHKIQQHDAYITIDDNDLVTLVHKVKLNNWKLGTDLGIMSYNETPLKSIIADGITTLTTDFEQMGKLMAEMILRGERQLIENPFKFINRGSF